MSNPFFDRPILNSPYERPGRHWELDDQGQPTQRIQDQRRQSKYITPIPKPKKRRAGAGQSDIIFDEGVGISTAAQQYDPTSAINEIRSHRLLGIRPVQHLADRPLGDRRPPVSGQLGGARQRLGG